ncbi:NAD(+) kinase [Bacteroidetes/Chlorobi group bacterium ChocPot_Mid]|jgi:NAD+ kinase|nr:MAG: NAD(+) kinase [Bacteroidetes/Chlorobi group bacterium ChocPot_Mid]
MKNVALFESTGKQEAIACAEITTKKLMESGINCCATESMVDSMQDEKVKGYIKRLPYSEFEKFADVLISFGGDGTMLSAARLMIKTDLPIMGINVGKLGFLAEYSVNDLDVTIEKLVKGDYRIIDRAVLQTELDGEVIYALNDFVIEKKDSSRMITIEAFTNKHLLGSIRADGLIITTPTGSTAYSLSCGGPILTPSAEVICITPISPHSLTLRPLVLPDTNNVELRVFSPTGESMLVADGQVKKVLNNSDIVMINKSEEYIKLIKPTDSSYYDLLRTKLLWAANYGDMNFKNNKAEE